MGLVIFEVLAVLEVLSLIGYWIFLLCNCKGRAVRGLTSKKQKIPFKFCLLPRSII